MLSPLHQTYDRWFDGYDHKISYYYFYGAEMLRIYVKTQTTREIQHVLPFTEYPEQGS